MTDATKATPRPWSLNMVRSSESLEETGYAHQIVKGGHEYVVAHTWQKNYEHIHTERLPNGYVRQTGIGPIVHNMTPHPDAALIVRAVNSHDDLVAALKKIENSLKYMREEAEAQGAKLNAMAAQIANYANFLKEIARAALASEARDG